MSFDKHSKTLRLWMPLLASMSLSLSLAVNAAAAASPAPERSAMLASPADPLPTAEVLDSYSDVSFEVTEMAWLQNNRFDSVVLLLMPNDKKDKKNKHDDEGNRDKDHGDRDYDRDGTRTGSVSVQVLFGERDREIIRGYCSQQSSHLPPGLAKRGGHLPPGLEKQLRRNGQLPPGLQKKVDRCPKELERLLPPLPPNYARVFVEGRGLIIDAQFNIVDIIDIFR